MCGRYVIDITEELPGMKAIIEEAQRRAAQFDSDARGRQQPTVKVGEVFPGDVAAVLVAHGEKTGADTSYVLALDDHELGAYPMIWGYPGFDHRGDGRGAARSNPSSSNRSARKSPELIFNTRIEQAAQKPLWRDSISSRRCIVPSNGFYEWQKQGGGSKASKQRFLFELSDEPIVYLAGIYQAFIPKEQQDSDSHILSVRFSILTTQPNDSVRDIHDRMPVVLRSDEINEWLFGDWASLADRSKVELIRRQCA